MCDINFSDPTKSASKLSFYQIQSSIGDGGYGKVYKAIHIKTKQAVAIKHIKMPSNASPEMYHKLLIMVIRELEILT